MEAAIEVSLMYHNLIQNQIRFIDHMTDKLNAINSKQEKTAQEIQMRAVLNKILTDSEESDDDVKIKKSDFEENSEEEELQKEQRRKKMEQKKERVRRTEEMGERKESGMDTVEDLKELWSAFSLHDEEKAELQYLRQKFRNFPQKTSSEEKERDDAEMERKWTALGSCREEMLLQEIEKLKEKLKMANNVHKLSRMKSYAEWIKRTRDSFFNSRHSPTTTPSVSPSTDLT